MGIPGSAVLQHTALVCELQLELETPKPCAVVFVRETSWYSGGIEICWTQFRIILCPVSGGVSVSCEETLEVTAAVGADGGGLCG